MTRFRRMECSRTCVSRRTLSTTTTQSYQIIPDHTKMPVTPDELEAAIRAAMQVTHVHIEDNSSGCGQSYTVLIVSKVVDTRAGSKL